MKRLLLLVILPLLAALLFSCEKERILQSPGNLVPQTVKEDAGIPHIEVNGTKLHAESYGDSLDPMLVFLHGGPGGDYRNALPVKQLANDGYYVVFYDQRGSGLSERHSKNTYSINLMLEDLSAVIAHYRSSDTQKVILFGHSWGAMLAAGYINAYPARINGAILAEPGGLNKTLLEEYADKSRRISLFNEATNDVFYFDQFLTGKADEHAILDYKMSLTSPFSYVPGNNEGIEGPSPFWRNGAVVLNAFIKIAEEDGFDFTHNLHQFTAKTLFLYGEKNRSYGHSFAQKEAAYFPHHTIVKINDTGHEMIWFKWDTVHPVVLNYLQSL